MKIMRATIIFAAVILLALSISLLAGAPPPPADCTLTDEEIELTLSTLNAHSFNFSAPDLSAGTQPVTGQAVGIAHGSSDGSAAATFAGAESVARKRWR